MVLVVFVGLDGLFGAVLLGVLGVAGLGVVGVVVAVVLLLFVVSLFYGTVHFTPAEVWQALLGHDTTSTAAFIVRESRFPQAVTALLCGAALQRERKQGKVLKFHGKCIAEGGRKGFPHGLHGENLTVPVVQNKSLVEFNLSAEHTRPPDCHIIQ